MKKYSSQRILISQDELQRIQQNVTKSLQPMFKARIKRKSEPEQCQFKPDINKQSINLQRTIHDLYRWNLNKQQKIQQIQQDETKEIQNNANRLTHQITSPSVFERLYQIRKNSEFTLQQSKRNSYNNKPYYTKNMTKSMFQEYQRLYTNVETTQFKSKTQATENSLLQTPIQEVPPSINDMKITLPLHQYIDLTQQIQDQHSSDTATESIIQEKEIEAMVQRLNNWQAKKLEREQLNALEYNSDNKPFSSNTYTQTNSYSNIVLNI
ncbi:unnamed protein product [Paramecium sonneborni]|uniref:Uncharacterized protein n=1 Tax=Paramecium sonneborni TaxID=65129 RepID=A0A8S1Q308_9CILI|nr:unnamed protein product [Paramecium sonneborni]